MRVITVTMNVDLVTHTAEVGAAEVDVIDGDMKIPMTKPGVA